MVQDDRSLWQGQPLPSLDMIDYERWSDMDEVTISEIRTKVRKHWQGDAALPLCEAILDRIDVDRVEEFSFRDVVILAGAEEIDGLHIKSVTILTNLSAFDASMVFRDDDGSEHRLSSEAASAVLGGGAYHHPITGQIVPDADARIYPRFRVNPSLLAATFPAP